MVSEKQFTRGLATARRCARGRGDTSWLHDGRAPRFAKPWRAAESRLRASLVGRAPGPDHPEDLSSAPASLRPASDALDERDREALALVAWDGLRAREAAIAGRPLARDVLRQPLHRRTQAADTLLGEARPTAPPSDGGTQA